MPRYYFHVRWPGRKDDDPTGMWLETTLRHAIVQSSSLAR